MSVVYDDEVIEFDESANQTGGNQQPQPQQGKYPWKIVIFCFVGLAIFFFIMIRSNGCSGIGGSGLDGEYYLYRNTVFHQVDGTITIKNGEFEKTFANMSLDSGKYEYDEDTETLTLGKLEFKVVREDGDVKALERVFEGGIHSESEIYYKQ